jgi:ABC-type Fe3+ transport system substrate-binding protein
MSEEENEDNTHIAIFNGKTIRRKLVNDEWFFSVVDVVGVLTDSENPRNYWKVLKYRLTQEGSEVVTKCNQLKLIAEDDKLRETDCANTLERYKLYIPFSSD